jgi:uncharacterized protein (TIGR04255 family)
MTQSSRPAIPDFARPPVTEVVLSLQFGATPAFRSVHAGLFWNSVRSEYPKVSEQAPLQPVFETFGGAPTVVPPFQIQTFTSPPMLRYWFETEDGQHLIQLQQDRILRNWRQQTTEIQYPRYEKLRDLFKMDVSKLEELFRTERLGDLRPNQCEITYINTIQLPKVNVQEHLDQITPLWAGSTSDLRSFDAEYTTIQTKRILRREDAPYGRIYVSFTPVLRARDYSPAVQLDITARGRPVAETVASAFDLLGEERVEIVRVFAEVTTKEMHKVWERTDAS